MDEDNIITLNDENGNEVEFEFLDLIPYRQNEYVVLLPIGDSDGQVVILQLKEIDDETEEYVGVENEFVLETVFALFKERNKDFFRFEYLNNASSMQQHDKRGVHYGYLASCRQNCSLLKLRNSSVLYS